MRFILILSFLILALNSQSQNSIEFYNNTNKEIFVSYVHFDFANKSWTSKGWYKVAPYSPFKVNLGNYTGDIYVHGFSVNPATFWESETRNNWGKGFSFCVDPKNAFEMRYADKIDCEHRSSFTKYTIKAGVNEWTFNP